MQGLVLHVNMLCWIVNHVNLVSEFFGSAPEQRKGDCDIMMSEQPPLGIAE